MKKKLVFLLLLSILLNSCKIGKNNQQSEIKDNNICFVSFPDFENLKIKKVNEYMALDEDGHVWVHSNNYISQITFQTSNIGYYPVWKEDGTLLDDIIDIAANEYVFYALAGDHTVWAWGKDYYGLLSVKKEIRKNGEVKYPSKIVDSNENIVTGVEKIATSTATYFLMEDGTISVFGHNGDSCQLLNRACDWENDESVFEDLEFTKETLLNGPYECKLAAIPYPEIMENICDAVDIYTSTDETFYKNKDGNIYGIGEAEKNYDFDFIKPSKICNMHLGWTKVALLDDGSALSWSLFCSNDNAYLLGHNQDEAANLPYRVRINGSNKFISGIEDIAGCQFGVMVLKNGQLWRQGDGPQENGKDLDIYDFENAIELDEWNLGEDVLLMESNNNSSENTPKYFHQKYPDGTPVNDVSFIYANNNSMFFINNEGVLYCWGNSEKYVEYSGVDDDYFNFPRKVTFHPYFDDKTKEWSPLQQGEKITEKKSFINNETNVDSELNWWEQ